ncbi:hypothetical protein TNCV_1578171 [Trichonephila clavipes]|nr:hypothetical protein TNCV_1578171 [Trichonephila clavipes]
MPDSPSSSATLSMMKRRFALIMSSTFLKKSSTIVLDTGKCQHDRCLTADPDTYGITHNDQSGTSRALP